MTRRHKTDRRNPGRIAHSILIRYDYDAGRWIHSAGIVITPREATLLEALARGHGPASMAQGTASPNNSFYAAQARLKQYLGIPVRSAQGQRQLLKIAMDLYGTSKQPAAILPWPSVSRRGASVAPASGGGERTQLERVSSNPSQRSFANSVSASSASADGAFSQELP